MDTNDNDIQEKIIDEYLSNGISCNLLKNILQINPDEIFKQYVEMYVGWKSVQEIKSKQEYIKCIETPECTQINFNTFDQFDKWIEESKYKSLLGKVINKLREIGRILGPVHISKLQLKYKSINKYNIYTYDFFTKESVQPNFLTLQKIFYTFGFSNQIFSYEFKTFFTCGHRPIGLINNNINTIFITWNVDTINEFMKKLDSFEQVCIDLDIKSKFEEFKIIFIELKNYIIQIILRTICNKLIKQKLNVNLSLQECDYHLFEYIKKNMRDLFVGMVYSPQNTLTYEIKDIFNFASNPSKEKIYQTNIKSDTSFGFVTLSTLCKNLSVTQVFNSLVLNHEKKSRIRGLSFTTRGVYIPELQLYNLHLKSSNTYKNLIALEKYHFEKDISVYESIYGLGYNFTNKSYTQLLATKALTSILPHINLEIIHHMIDVIFEHKYSFDQILLELSKTTQIFSCLYSNILDGVNCTNSDPIFTNIDFNTFVKAINIHYTKKLENWVCSTILKKVIKNYENMPIDMTNPDLIIKEFFSNLNQTQTCIDMQKQDIQNLTICGDINMILIESDCSRIKKYSFRSNPNEDEPFNHLLNMKMFSSGNNAIFCL